MQYNEKLIRSTHIIDINTRMHNKGRTGRNGLIEAFKTTSKC